MKRMLMFLLALGLFIPTMQQVGAQAEGSAYAPMGEPAVYYNENREAVATLQVNEVEAGWAENSEYSEPTAGAQFTAVHFTITNLTDAGVIIEPFDFTIIDTTGRHVGRSYVQASDDADPQIFSEDLAMSANESVDLMVVFELPTDMVPAVLVWQPEYGKMVLADLGAQKGDGHAFAAGLNSPATAYDERGGQLATFEVTGFERGWDQHSEYTAPEPGHEFVAIDFTVTNLSGTNMILKPFSFGLIDAEGLNIGQSYVSLADGATTVEFREDVALEADGSFDGSLVYMIPTDVEVSVINWQPESGSLVMIDLSEGGSATPADGTPAASPVDDAATPAADAGDAKSPSVASATGDVVDVNSEPVPFVDIMGDEQGTIIVVSTTDNFTEVATEPAAGERVFLVTMVVNTDTDPQFVDPSGMSVTLEDGTSVPAAAIESAPDAATQITSVGEDVPAGGAVEFTFAFLLEEGQVPVELVFDTGVEPAVVSLQP